MKRKGKTDPTREYLRRRRTQFQPWLSAMGLSGLLAALTPTTQRVFLTFKNPPPDMLFDNAPHWWPKLRSEIESYWRRETFEPFGNGQKLPLTEGITIYPMIIAGLSSILSRERHLRERFGDPPAMDNQVIAESSQALGNVLFTGLRCVASVDDILIRVERPDLFPNEKSRFQLRWRISCFKAQQERVKIEGKVRPVYRMANPCDRAPLEWAAFDASAFGLSPRAEKLPVYIQAHALKRLYERLKFWPDKWTRHLQWCNAVFQGAAAASMNAPRLARCSGNEFLVEYRLGDLKLGYLAAELIEPKVIIKTFLLSGMEGTPEGAMVRKKLKLSKSEIEWLGIDRLEEWSTSDLRFDPAIRLLLEECGLSDLLRYVDGHREHYFTELAETFRKFVGDEKMRQASERVIHHPGNMPDFGTPRKLSLD